MWPFFEVSSDYEGAKELGVSAFPTSLPYYRTVEPAKEPRIEFPYPSTS